MLTRSRPRLRSPRRLPWLLAIAAAISTASLGWVAWQLIEQDEAEQARRAQETVDREADRAVQALERIVAEADRILSDWVQQRQAPPTFEHGGLMVVTAGDVVRASGTPALLFWPATTIAPEPAGGRFAEADAAEFGHRDFGRARALLRPLTRASDPSVRAAALLRLGRVQRTAGDLASARATFQTLASLREARVAGLPAELAGQVAEMSLLADARDETNARAVARVIAKHLSSGHWHLTEAQFDHYVEEVTAVAGAAPPIDAVQLAMTRAIARLVDEAREGLAPSGRRTVEADSGALLVLWRRTATGVGAWITDAAPLLARVDVATGVTVALDGKAPTAKASVRDLTALRHASATGLPWTIRAQLTGDVASANVWTRTRLVVLGAALLAACLITGFWLAGRAAQRELELARTQSDFVATVSHEFRTPLAAMRQLSDLLASGRVPSEQRRQQYYESLASESRRLQRLVENLLDFGRLQAGARTFTLGPLDTAGLVARVVEEFRTQPLSRPCDIDVIAEQQPVAMYADADAMALALHNLIDNAVKYAGEQAHVTVSWQREGDRIALHVSDDGAGIGPEDRARIFDRFVRGSGAMTNGVRGTGIGLAVVKQVITGQGGEVAVDSEPGRGSTFTIRMPLANAHSGGTA